ncbi:MAG: ABC transporter ATP-binding protein [Gammaproteobacteria bacterium]|nr:ABC transporter ATP-binding protein [Gammaproteobacteria bacterium]
MSDPVLELIGTRMTFGKRRVLAVGRVEFPSNGCLVLTGANGSGKTTLLKIAAGLLKPDEATVSFDGMDFPWPQAARQLRERVVYLHQFPYMFDATVFDNVAYGLRRTGMPKPEIRTRVRQCLEWSGLDDHATQNARSLSGGERQRVALARARALKPRLLLLDEPTANMDEEGRQQTVFFIRRMVADGLSVAVATHEKHLVSQVAQVHWRMHDGDLVEASVGTRSGPRGFEPGTSQTTA